jgi:multiple antibiotic resistance protein
MTLNLLTMLFADRLMRLIGRVPLTILGAVFGVLQLALGIEMLASGVALITPAGG